MDLEDEREINKEEGELVQVECVYIISFHINIFIVCSDTKRYAIF